MGPGRVRGGKGEGGVSRTVSEQRRYGGERAPRLSSAWRRLGVLPKERRQRKKRGGAGAGWSGGASGVTDVVGTRLGKDARGLAQRAYKEANVSCVETAGLPIKAWRDAVDANGLLHVPRDFLGFFTNSVDCGGQWSSVDCGGQWSSVGWDGRSKYS
ncbi:hypothetical protein ABZP36_014116 [Zizania latifolia]